jgi:hypothetical protein
MHRLVEFLVPYRHLQFKTSYTPEEVTHRLSHKLTDTQVLLNANRSAWDYLLHDSIGGHDYYVAEVDGNRFRLRTQRSPIDRSLPIAITGMIERQNDGSLVELRIGYSLLLIFALLAILAFGSIGFAITGLLSILLPVIITVFVLQYTVALIVFSRQTAEIRRTFAALFVEH